MNKYGRFAFIVSNLDCLIAKAARLETKSLITSGVEQMLTVSLSGNPMKLTVS